MRTFRISKLLWLTVAGTVWVALSWSSPWSGDHLVTAWTPTLGSPAPALPASVPPASVPPASVPPASVPPAAGNGQRLLGVSSTAAGETAAVRSGPLEIKILPGDFRLHTGQGRQRLVVVRAAADHVAAAVPPGAIEWSSSDPTVVRIEGSVAVAMGNGQARLRASVPVESLIGTATQDEPVPVSPARLGRASDPVEESEASEPLRHRSAEVDVVVEGYELDRIWSFRHDVQSIFSKNGCNQGACHGALAGKGGFRLSLQAYDDRSDHFNITAHLGGRRIEPSDPGRSLLLAKPTGAVPHQGGLRLDVESRDYQILAEWIAAGAAGPQEEDPELRAIEIFPPTARLQPGESTQLLVSAHYSDGRRVDVTDWSLFSSTDEAIAGVDDSGRIQVRGSGEGAVLVWYGSQVALARLTVPYPHDLPATVFQQAPRRNFIDDLNLAQLETLGLPPSPRCDDDTFLRRSTLDTIGRLPTTEERQRFYQREAEQRRDAWIEDLLADDSFVDYWTYTWSDLLLINGTRLRPPAVKAYYTWLRQQVQENRPWDELVRQVLTATGTSTENGATNFYALHQSPEDMTENACQAFLGLSIGCARCHNHPLEKWTNDQYYSMANLFARVRAKGWGGEPRNGDGLRTVFVADEGELLQPGKGRPQPPAPLDGQPIAFDDPRDRREILAQWLTDPGNPYFARSITNRVWANFFGQGLVEPVDDLRLSNPAANEPLLQAAADYLVDQEFDLRQLMRAILQSETYQRSSLPLEENRQELKYLSRYYPRRLMAEVLLDAIDQVLETSTAFTEIAFPGADRQATDFYPLGTKAIQLYDSSIASTFLQAFGRHNREITCECQRSDEPNLIQALHLSNGDTVNLKLAEAENWIGRQLAEEIEDRALIAALFAAALQRTPTEAEQQQLLEVLAEYPADQRRQAIEDVVWSVLTSSEFTFNH